jgi:hypothetical protein
MNDEVIHVWNEMVKTVVQELICADLFRSAYCHRFRVNFHLVRYMCSGQLILCCVMLAVHSAVNTLKQWVLNDALCYRLLPSLSGFHSQLLGGTSFLEKH